MTALTPHPFTSALNLLWADLPANVETEPQTRSRWRSMLPHVLAAAGQRDRDTTDHAERLTWLLDRAGAYLRTQGDPHQARPLLDRALRIGETARRPGRPGVATYPDGLVLVLLDLALVMDDQGDPDAARTSLHRALQMMKTD